MSETWEKCPRCESNRVIQLGKVALFFILLGSGSCLIWVGLLFPPIWIVAGLLILLSPAGFLIPKMNMCKDCNEVWKAGHAEEYKQAKIDKQNAKKNKK